MPLGKDWAPTAVAASMRRALLQSIGGTVRDRHSQVHVARVALVLALALLGDALLYVVLPLHAPSFGVTFAWVGILLSANRLVRIIGYGAVANIGRRIGLRRLTIAAAVGATLSTAAYGLRLGETRYS